MTDKDAGDSCASAEGISETAFDNLLSPTAIKLYGVQFEGLQVAGENPSKRDARSETGRGKREVLRNDLEDTLAREDVRLARIYAFTYEGVFYMMPRPCIFVVHGDGRHPTDGEDNIAAKDWHMTKDMRQWEVDRCDVSVRIDTESGTMEEILLEAAIYSGNVMPARAELVSRAELASRAELTSRAELASRAELTSRAEMATRHRLKR